MSGGREERKSDVLGRKRERERAHRMRERQRKSVEHFVKVSEKKRRRRNSDKPLYLKPSFQT